MKRTKIIVIGTSAGGLNALTQLVQQLEPGMNAAFFIVMHLSAETRRDFLFKKLQSNTILKCVLAEDGLCIEKGYIYIADRRSHLLLKKGEIALGYGPAENRWRPSINVLFRSAAAAYGSLVTGIILTGLLDDGVSGMQAIRKCGGTCIVQDPNDAEYPDMPFAVLQSMDVDYCVPLNEMDTTISGILKKEPTDAEIPAEVIIESEIAEKNIINYDNLQQLGNLGLYACPDCGGGLFEIKTGDNTRYRCHIGHSYSEAGLAAGQIQTIESTLWIALRMMEERRSLLQRMELKINGRSAGITSFGYKQKAIDMQQHIEELRELLFKIQRRSM